MTFTIRRSWTDDRFCQRTGDDACGFDGLVTVEQIDYQGTPFAVWSCPDCGQQRGSAAGLYDRTAVLWFELPLADVPLSASEAVALYREDLAFVVGEAAEDYPEVVEGLAELRGKDLACWCRLDQPCHADVLLKIANEASP